MSADAELPSIEDVVIGPALPDRSCGDCVACCHLMFIDQPELQKPEGVLCRHCTGTGCSIYERRPQVCRDWHCVWRRVEAMPAEARPDRLRIMFSLERPERPINILRKLYIRGLAFNSREDFTSPAGADAINLFRGGRIPVWLDDGHRMGLAHPRQPVADIVLRGLPPASREAAREAEEWLKLYADD